MADEGCDPGSLHSWASPGVDDVCRAGEGPPLPRHPVSKSVKRVRYLILCPLLQSEDDTLVLYARCAHLQDRGRIMPDDMCPRGQLYP
eukprot:6618527-Prorocentrum_lima.AAC.1